MSRKSTKIQSEPISTIGIEIAVSKYFNFRSNLIVPNISWGFNIHECDLFVVRKSGMAIEIEIKIIKSDFLKDLQKWHQHKDNRIREFYYAMPESLYEKIKDLITEHAGIIICKKINNNVKCWIEKKAKIN